MEKKKLLIYAHYYYPDVASTGQILTELAEGLMDTFSITVICVVPSYTGKIQGRYKKKSYYWERENDVTIIRVRVPEFSKSNKISRIKNILSYFFGAIGASMKIPRQDYILAISQPPILGGILGVIGKVLKRGKLLYNIQDFNPEQTIAIKYAGNPLVLKTMLAVDKYTCRKSDQVILVGRDMTETLELRFKNKPHPSHTVINNWVDERTVIPLSKEDSHVQAFKKKYKLEDKYVIVYSGNIGLYYDLENIFTVLQKFRSEKNVVFAFIGDGTIKDKLLLQKKEHMMDNVVFIPYQPKEELVYSLNAADAHWVINAKGIKGISVPSKVYGVMAVGKPIIGVLEKGSEARTLIEESHCGYVVEPGDYNAIQDVLEAVLADKKRFENLGMNGRTYLEAHLSKEASIQKYKETIENLEKKQSFSDKEVVRI